MIYEKHLADYSEHIEDLRKRRAEMVVETTPMGLFNAIDVPDRAGPTWSRRTASSARYLPACEPSS